MTTYVALLRGIGPSNPNMHGKKLRSVFEKLGFKKVLTLLSSGNVIFDSGSKNVRALELKIEKALKAHLDINSPAYIRSQHELELIIKKDPFKGARHSGNSYLIVSFLKRKPWEIYGNIDITQKSGPQFMRDIEKKFGKDVTTRTWKTVQRIVEKMQE
ncbi:MAG: DUF1697 domain-containing protein [Patescibacteria group bacterium]|nr:DUF1697 domain-containing protein [Patescibacteria group bacterium]